MASVSLFNLSAGTTLASGDVLVFCDISDTTQSANGSDLKITLTNFFAGIPVPVNVTSASATALAVGRLGATTPAFTVDASTASQVAGLKVTGAATGGTVAAVVTDSGTNASLTLNAKGSGTIGIGTVSTGTVTIGTSLTVTGASSLAALAATSGTFSSTLGVTGASTLAALSATTGSFSSTLGVTGATTLAGLSATTGSFSSTLGVTGAATLSSTLTIGGLTYTFPASQTANRYLKTDGAGALSWATILETIALTDLSDVTITSQATGQILRASSASAWANSTATFPDTATAGHLLYASASNVWSGLTIGAANTVLLSTGSAPSWVAQSTLTAPAGLLTGTTLASNVVTSSLTAIGTLSSGAVPASLVTAGTFGSGSFTFPGALAITGALTGVTTLTTSGAINGQTISSAASFTGTLAVAGAVTSTVGNNAPVLVGQGATTGYMFANFTNTSGQLRWAVEGSSGGSLVSGSSAYASLLGSTGATSLQLFTSNTTRLTIDSAGAATFSGTLAVTGATTLSSTLSVTNNTATGNGLLVQCDSVTTGNVAKFVSNNGGAFTGTVVSIINDFNNAQTATALYVRQDDDGKGIVLDMSRFGVGLTINSPSSAAVGLSVTGGGSTSLSGTLAVTGVTTFSGNVFTGTGTGAILFRTSGGALSGPALAFVGDDDTGLWNPVAGTLQLVANSTAALTLTSSAATFSGTLAVSGAITATGGSVQVSGSTNPFMSLHDGTGYAYVEVVSGVLRMTPRSGQSILLNAATTVGSTLLASGTVRFSAYGAGTATFDASGNITSVSDERHKTDILPFTAGLTALRGIAPITHKYNADSGLETEHTYIGFSAQNVRDHIPGAVFAREDGILSLWDRGILAATVNAVQSLDARLTALESA